MSHFDAFNGDADGICSLLQLRLDSPRESTLVTGVKRDIALLERIPAARGDSVTALDISADTNRTALRALLDEGVTIDYYDHHYAGELPSHSNAVFHIDTSPAVCTGVIVDRVLAGRQRIWAVVAAFGDDLLEAGRTLAATLDLDGAAVASLRELGECIAYNAYGDSEADLLVHPAGLYRTLHKCADPFRFIEFEPLFDEIKAMRESDLEHARRHMPEQAPGAPVYILPDAPWSRRVRGAFGNELAAASPDRAHAILTPNARGGYTVSVRAPRSTQTGADAFCREFATGGGRARAAGINNLPADQIDEFTRRFGQAFR
ncbi:MAG TPA: acetyltransferase [Casimicrobiaceae bacterium]|nr:acetyltransferase [Casimicrobiaceae bacterium]